jgi:hypothetical protein
LPDADRLEKSASRTNSEHTPFAEWETWESGVYFAACRIARIMNEIENSISFNLNFKYLISLQTEEIETRDREGLAGRVV